MPIYEYICEDCKAHFESMRPIAAADQPIECQSCKSTHTHRLISSFFSKNSNGGGNGGGCSSCAGGHCASCGH